MSADFIGKTRRPIFLSETHANNIRGQQLQPEPECRLPHPLDTLISRTASSQGTNLEGPDGRLLTSAAWVGWWFESQ